jgi:hypothetical protein
MLARFKPCRKLSRQFLTPTLIFNKDKQKALQASRTDSGSNPKDCLMAARWGELNLNNSGTGLKNQKAQSRLCY